MPKYTKVVSITVTAIYEGTYYGIDELVDVTSDWIISALEDRDDLVRSEISGHVTEITFEEEL